MPVCASFNQCSLHSLPLSARVHCKLCHKFHRRCRRKEFRGESTCRLCQQSPSQLVEQSNGSLGLPIAPTPEKACVRAKWERGSISSLCPGSQFDHLQPCHFVFCQVGGGVKTCDRRIKACEARLISCWWDIFRFSSKHSFRQQLEIAQAGNCPKPCGHIEQTVKSD